jgi:hypothetical protein
LFCLALTVPLAVFAPEKSQLTEDQGKIVALEAVCNRAGQSKDITYIDSDASLRNHEQFLAHVKVEADSHAHDERSRHARLRRLRRGYRRLSRQVDQERGTAILPGRSTDTWAKIDGNWQCVACQATGNAQ